MENMEQNFRKLVELQEIDMQIHELEVSAEEYPVKLSELKTLIGNAQKNIGGIETKLESLETEKKNVNSQLAEAREGLDKSQERLNTIRTNREYDAVHTEIETQKQLATRADTRLSSLDGDRTRLEESLARAREEFEKVKQENERPLAELEEKIGSIDSKVAELVTQRNAIIADIPKHFFRMYNHIFNRRKNRKVLSMVAADNTTCAICHIVLSSQLINDLRRKNTLLLCQSCGSILLWEEAAGTNEAESRPGE